MHVSAARRSSRPPTWQRRSATCWTQWGRVGCSGGGWPRRPPSWRQLRVRLPLTQRCGACRLAGCSGLWSAPLRRRGRRGSRSPGWRAGMARSAGGGGAGGSTLAVGVSTGRLRSGDTRSWRGPRPTCWPACRRRLGWRRPTERPQRRVRCWRGWQRCSSRSPAGRSCPRHWQWRCRRRRRRLAQQGRLLPAHASGGGSARLPSPRRRARRMANGWRSEARGDARRVDGCRRVRVLCSFFASWAGSAAAWLCGSARCGRPRLTPACHLTLSRLCC